MTQRFPSPYKLVIGRHEPPGEDRFTIIDTLENPFATTKEGTRSLFKLSNCCTGSLQRFHTTLDNINGSRELEGTGCKYYLVGLDVDFNPDNAWIHRCYVLKLANCEAEFRAAVGRDVYTPDTSGSSTPVATLYQNRTVHIRKSETPANHPGCECSPSLYPSGVTLDAIAPS
ncbi:hypothetical protein Dda_1966 [Drechslerella dactyloides]|uniref:Uncharacterized protein n=1 Tax=Drechslerella dactyloides TaxID=74499 RepID=A0AAD6J2V2_DREDA|nr:hypothetical protein Dda_1966 [Drechslerella dactyloides]